ncbi:hypothetical protein Lal_00010217 [Lupinus albus]|nr:hypothetical protein Lal_00010217 [Lupinus albus]
MNSAAPAVSSTASRATLRPSLVREESEEAVMNGELNLTDDVEAVTEEEVVVTVNRTSEGVFNRENRSICDPKLHRFERYVKLVARNGLAFVIFADCSISDWDKVEVSETGFMTVNSGNMTGATAMIILRSNFTG